MQSLEAALGYRLVSKQDKINQRELWDSAKVALEPLNGLATDRGWYWKGKDTPTFRVSRVYPEVTTCGLAIGTASDATVLLMARRHGEHGLWRTFLEFYAHVPGVNGSYQVHAKTDVGTLLGKPDLREYTEVELLMMQDTQEATQQAIRWDWSREVMFDGPRKQKIIIQQTEGKYTGGSGWSYERTQGLSPASVVRLIDASIAANPIDPAKSFVENTRSIRDILYLQQNKSK